MQQFLMIAAAHFLALLSPGPDFFLVARSAMTAGWRTATGACVGIALANGVFIVAAFGGVSVFHPDGDLFAIIQLAGCIYLFYIGALFIRHAGHTTLASVQTTATRSKKSWWRGARMGFLSGLLNPKNALFYASLASMLGSHASGDERVFYGLWMFSAVLLWDVLVAVAIGNKAVLQRFSSALPGLERVSGAFLILLATTVMASTAASLTA